MASYVPKFGNLNLSKRGVVVISEMKRTMIYKGNGDLVKTIRFGSLP